MTSIFKSELKVIYFFKKGVNYLLTRFLYLLTRFLTMLTRYTKLVYKFYFISTVDFLIYFYANNFKRIYAFEI